MWVVFAPLATTNAVRETYLAVRLGTRLSVRVDEYLGLHTDLFENPGEPSLLSRQDDCRLLAGRAPVLL